MAANPYDLIPYPTFPRPQTHPDRLAAVGKLFGMEPAPLAGCRVLEIGCGDGGNLIPMAYALAASRFVGVDLASGPVAAGMRMAADLALDNLALRVADLREIGAAWGEFDYILAHGVYSWVPEDVRERLLAVCRERLAPEGIAFVSYNAQPGGHVRQMLREMLLYRTRHAESTAERIRQAREFLEFLQRVRLLSAPWQALRDHEVKLLLDRDDGGLYHDELAECNQRFYFHEFAAAARRHGLEYLGEAEPHEMFDPTGALAGFEGDLVEREQYLDFLKARRFRQTLLCRAERPLRRQISPEQMREFLFSAPARRLENGQIEGARGVCITPANEAAARVALALGEVHPLPLPFEDLVPYAGGVEALSEIAYRADDCRLRRSACLRFSVPGQRHRTAAGQPPGALSGGLFARSDQRVPLQYETGRGRPAPGRTAGRDAQPRGDRGGPERRIRPRVAGAQPAMDGLARAAGGLTARGRSPARLNACPARRTPFSPNPLRCSIGITEEGRNGNQPANFSGRGGRRRLRSRSEGSGFGRFFAARSALLCGRCHALR